MRSSLRLRVPALVFALLMPVCVIAAPGTYTGKAPVNSQSDEERTAALKTALANVVIEQAGDSAVLARPDVARAVAQAERYVLQYTYRRNSGSDDAGAPLTLVAQFDSNAVDQMLGKLGLGAAAAEPAAPETPSEATVWIGGIRNAADYARVIAYLGRNNFVRDAQVTRADRDGIQMHLALATDLAHFLDAIGMERTLAVVAAPAQAAPVDATLALTP